MKSVALKAIAKPEEVRGVLDQLLPGQREPWLLLTKEGDPIAYFHLEPDGISIQADISGRHYNEEDAVTGVLGHIAAVVGGRIEHDFRLPNKPDSAHPAMALWYAIEDQWRRVTDLGR